MFGLFCFVLAVLASPFKSKSRLEAENAVLRHQLIVLRRKVQGRVRLTNNDRWFLIQLYRWFPSILNVLTIIRPETLVRWHRAGFRCYWRWKSCPRGGRPLIEADLRALIRQMSVENPFWGAPRIHGELLKLGFEVAQSSVAKYMVKRRGPPSQGWRTFLRNHAPDIAAMDLFVIPTIGFNLLYAFVIVRLGRRDLVWINVTTNPTAEWIARQITEAFPWNEAPHYLIRDRDRIYGAIVTRRIRAMGIRDKPTAPASPWQNGFAERLIGSIRRECVDHIVVLGEAHLRRILRAYAGYYNNIRTHRSLAKDAPVSRPAKLIYVDRCPVPIACQRWSRLNGRSRHCRTFAYSHPALISDDLVIDYGAFIERTQARPLHGRDVHEHIFPAALRRNEPISLRRIEPLHGTCCHYHSPLFTLRPNHNT